MARSYCIICWQPVDPKTAHYMHIPISRFADQAVGVHYNCLVARQTDKPQMVYAPPEAIKD